MLLDPVRLRIEADAHEARLRGPLWRPAEGEREGDDWTTALRSIGVDAVRSLDEDAAPSRNLRKNKVHRA